MQAVKTYCDWHLGDNFIHLNFIRRLALRYPDVRFIHAAKPEYLWQLQAVVRDLKNCSLDGNREPSGWIDAWKNANGAFFGHPKMGDFTEFHLDHFSRLAKRIGLDNPITCERDLLFDYPALNEKVWWRRSYDYLFINSRPMSTQLSSYRDGFFKDVMRRLVASGKSVASTRNDGVDGVICTEPLSCTEVGNVAMACKNIVGVATGPMWPTLNVFHVPQKRVVCLDRRERFTLGGAVQCETVAEVERAIGI